MSILYIVSIPAAIMIGDISFILNFAHMLAKAYEKVAKSIKYFPILFSINP